jgi:hypothetical protein
MDQPSHVTSISGFNGRRNQVVNSGSALAVGIGGLFVFDMRFSTFARNGAANRLVFVEIRRPGTVTSVNVMNNTCQSSGEYGLVYVATPLTFDRCVFSGNAFDHFLGGGKLATMRSCAFDFTVITTVRNMSLALTNCTFGAAVPWVDEEIIAAVHTELLAPVVGGGIMAVTVAIAVASVAGCSGRQWCTGRK